MMLDDVGLDDSRGCATALSPIPIYPAVTPRSLFIEPITDVFRIGRRATVHTANIPWVGNDVALASPTAAQIGVRETGYPLFKRNQLGNGIL